jgi:hypothetical protein
MSSGKRYKFNGSEIQILSSYDESPGDMAVSAISQTNPAVATVDSTTILGATGDIGVIRLSSVEGMTDVDDGTYIVQVASGTTLTMLGVDATDYDAFTGTALAFPGVFQTWCEPTSLNRQGDAAPEIDATTVCSTFQEFERGLIGFGNVTIDFNFAPKTSVQLAIAEFELSGDITAIRYALPNNGGERIVQGFISQTSEQGSNGTLWTGSLNFRSTGAPVTVVD